MLELEEQCGRNRVMKPWYYESEHESHPPGFLDLRSPHVCSRQRFSLSSSFYCIIQSILFLSEEPNRFPTAWGANDSTTHSIWKHSVEMSVERTNAQRLIPSNPLPCVFRDNDAPRLANAPSWMNLLVSLASSERLQMTDDPRPSVAMRDIKRPKGRTFVTIMEG